MLKMVSKYGKLLPSFRVWILVILNQNHQELMVDSKPKS
jgi:hypothetical protein